MKKRGKSYFKFDKIILNDIDKKYLIKYGTADCNTFNSLFLNIKCWVIPKDNLSINEYQRVINVLTTNVKLQLKEKLDKKIFDNKFFIDFDISSNSLSEYNKSFLDFELTLFTNTSNKKNSKNIKDYESSMIDIIYLIDNLLSKKNFICSTKNPGTIAQMNAQLLAENPPAPRILLPND